MKRIAEPGWNVDTLVAHIQANGASVETDNYGGIVLYIDLFEHSDGALYNKPENET